MDILKKVFVNDAPLSVAEIARELEAARTDRIAAASELTGLAERRAEALVSGSDAAVDKVKAEQTACARRLDRLDAVIARLEVKHAEAAAREIREQIERQAARALQAEQNLCAAYAAALLAMPADVRQFHPMAILGCIGPTANTRRQSWIRSRTPRLDGRCCRVPSAIIRRWMEETTTINAKPGVPMTDIAEPKPRRAEDAPPKPAPS